VSYDEYDVFSVLLMAMVVLLLLILICGGDSGVDPDDVEWSLIAVFVLMILIGDGNDAVVVPWRLWCNYWVE
jgi:hypothetical protein